MQNASPASLGKRLHDLYLRFVFVHSTQHGVFFFAPLLIAFAFINECSINAPLLIGPCNGDAIETRANIVKLCLFD
jgi:hypothetical protein